MKPNRQCNGLCTATIAVLSSLILTNTNANPTGGTVVHGNATFDSSTAGTLNITNTPGAIINWQDFSVGQNEVTNFIQQSSSSSVLNRVTGFNASEILGTLSSNGRVFIVNPNGVIFGDNVIIDTAGLIASTIDINNQDFIDGKMRFVDPDATGAILNKGVIDISDDGEVVLISPSITNEGTLKIEDGQMILAAGGSATISSLHYDHIEFEIEAPDDTVLNLGSLIAEGGSINVFTAQLGHSGIMSGNNITLDHAPEPTTIEWNNFNVENSGTVQFTQQTNNQWTTNQNWQNSSLSSNGSVTVNSGRLTLNDPPVRIGVTNFDVTTLSFTPGNIAPFNEPLTIDWANVVFISADRIAAPERAITSLQNKMKNFADNAPWQKMNIDTPQPPQFPGDSGWISFDLGNAPINHPITTPEIP